MIVSGGSEGTQVHKLPRLHIGGLGSIRPQQHLHLAVQTTSPLRPSSSLHASAGEDTSERRMLSTSHGWPLLGAPRHHSGTLPGNQSC